MRAARLSFHGMTLAGALGALLTFAGHASAQNHHRDHHHPPGLETELHEKFYATWFMPDDPGRSCCNKADCYPTEVRYQNDQWYARRREDGAFIPVPWKKVERNRDNPDGRNHVCMPPPTATAYPPNTVFCFSLGGGI
jgi:hypothetical protein